MARALVVSQRLRVRTGGGVARTRTSGRHRWNRIPDPPQAGCFDLLFLSPCVALQRSSRVQSADNAPETRRQTSNPRAWLAWSAAACQREVELTRSHAQTLTRGRGRCKASFISFRDAREVARSRSCQRVRPALTGRPSPCTPTSRCSATRPAASSG